MNLEDNKKSCGDCTKCCDGWLSGKVQGHSFGNIGGTRIPCNFVLQGSGCGIYEQRPKNPCRNFQCAWLKIPEVPEHLKPNLSNVIVTQRGFGIYELTKAGETINNEAIAWWIEYCKINNFKLVYSQ
jgi:hypothetical protein